MLIFHYNLEILLHDFIEHFIQSLKNQISICTVTTTLHINILTFLPFCMLLHPCSFSQADFFHVLSLNSVVVAVNRWSCCNSSGCAAAEPAAWSHLSAEHLSSESHTELGDRSVLKFHWCHTHLLLESQRSGMMRTNCRVSNWCNLEAMQQRSLGDVVR